MLSLELKGDRGRTLRRDLGTDDAFAQSPFLGMASFIFSVNLRRVGQDPCPIFAVDKLFAVRLATCPGHAD